MRFWGKQNYNRVSRSDHSWLALNILCSSWLSVPRIYTGGGIWWGIMQQCLVRLCSKWFFHILVTRFLLRHRQFVYLLLPKCDAYAYSVGRSWQREVWQIATQSMQCWHVWVKLVEEVDCKAASSSEAVMEVLHLTNTAAWLRPSSVKTWCKHQIEAPLFETQTGVITQLRTMHCTLRCIAFTYWRKYLSTLEIKTTNIQWQSVLARKCDLWHTCPDTALVCHTLKPRASQCDHAKLHSPQQFVI